MKRRENLTLLMTLLLLTLLMRPIRSEALSTGEYETLLDEAEVVIVELMEENAELLIELADSWTSCATLVEETATEAAAVAVRPLLIELAGLKAERDVLRGRVLLFGIGGILTGLVVGVVIGVIL